MVSRRGLRSGLVLLAGVLLLVLGTSAWPRADAAPEDEGQPKKGGKTYRDEQLGLTAQSPAGWSMVVDKGRVEVRWKRLVTFNDGETDAQATLSVRPRSAARLDDLLADVRKDWQANPKLRVSSMRKIEPTGLRAIGSVVVDASFVRRPKAKKVKPGEVPPPPPPPVTVRVQATYYLGPANEYLLYATGQQTHWPRLRGALDTLRNSIKVERQVEEGPKGAGSYRDNRLRFTCTFPVGYTVVTPQRENHVVQFEGLSDDDPVLGIYAFRWEDSLERDADRLIAYYEDEKTGEASMRRQEVGSSEVVFVTAKATIGGKDRTVLIALFKRGDQVFRLRASMPQGTEGTGEIVFRRFVNGFKLGKAPE